MGPLFAGAEDGGGPATDGPGIAAFVCCVPLVPLGFLLLGLLVVRSARRHDPPAGPKE